MSASHPIESVDAPASLRRRFELAVTEVAAGDTNYRLLRPRSVDELFSEEDFALDERIPYWADCWPSGRVLAAHLADCEKGHGRALLELGCGIGLVSLVAAAAGFDVLATDYYAAALEFTAANAALHNLPNVDTRLVDWRALPDDLGTFDVVAASDVLYERPQIPLVAATIAHALAPGGVALVSDPGRRTAETFVDECDRRHLAARPILRVAIAEAGANQTVTIYEVRRR